MAVSHRRPLDSYRSDNTLVNALVGAAVTVFLAFLPFSSVLGGAAAGYLQRGDRRAGVRVGAISGAIAAIPILLIGGLVFGGMLFGMMAGAVRFSILSGFMMLLFVGFALVYAVGLSAAGGYLGVVLAERYEPQKN